MNRIALLLLTACLLTTGTVAAQVCEYKRGETKFLDYALCRYPEDSILVVDLPESDNWEKCIYYLQPFRPEKLLAVTKEKDGKEVASISDRSQIGNPCYLTKQYCDKALAESKQ